MGIRFYCPQGHKLNVKAFLAGKRGICPKCGAKFEIPLQSVEPAASAPAGKPVAAATGGHPPLPTVPMPTAASAVAPIAPDAHPVAPTTAVPAAPAPAAAANPATPPALAATTIPAAPPDPIAEAPAAVWYVRPNSGGQFGPAAGDMMRQWIADRRVGADSLVWREGWPEWQRAAAAFPQMAAQLPTTSSTPAWPAGAAAECAASEIDDDWVDAIIDTKHPVSHHRPVSRLQQNNWVLAVSLIVILLGAILAIYLVITAMQQNENDRAAPASSGISRPASRAANFEQQISFTAQGVGGA